MADSEIQSMIESHVANMVAESAESKQTQKTNLEESAQVDAEQAHKHKHHHKQHHHHKKAGHKHHHKKHHEKKQEQAKPVAQPEVKHVQAPASHSLVASKAKDFEKFSMPVDIPIDEVKAITLKVSPTYALDRVESVTLKSFRKVVGYDTFNSILKRDRDEKKDPSDHYNVTVSMMIQRVPEEKATRPLLDAYNGEKTLAETLDKGFPYDDADSTIDDQTPGWKGKAPCPATLVGKLNGENITKEALVNLVRDTDAPVTQGLVQLDADINKSDADNVSALFDSNVTRGALKNLLTDKPAPITTKLAQKSDADNVSALFDSNVTRGALKNLLTDKPAPITTKLA